MARIPRIDVAGVAQHVIQRGVNRSACFCDDLDREFYLASLQEAAQATTCRIHAYVLMTNHVHLLVTGDQVGCVSAMMQRLGRRYVRRLNARYRRTGTLWEGRFKSSLIDSEGYLLTCYRYIEMNPVRAHMVNHPHEHPWSSVHANAYGQWDPLVEPHPAYQQLSIDDQERLALYRELLEQAQDPAEITVIRAHVNQGKVLGSRRFQRQIAELTGRCVTLKPMGRPRMRHDETQLPEKST